MFHQPAVGGGGCGRGRPSGGRHPPPAVVTTSLAAATLPLRELPPGIVEDDGVEETGAARLLSAAGRYTESKRQWRRWQ
jgi:hypothetical protein